MEIWIKTGMYYLRTKSAVDAIKFTLTNKEKAQVPETAAAVAAQAPIKGNKATSTAAVPVEPLTPEELKAMLQQSRESEDDDCLMCGS